MQPDVDNWSAGNRAWMAQQHWVDISNNDKGLTWCSTDAPLIELGGITANNTSSWDGKDDVWPSNIRPSATLYSWVMNNHWFTNTPLTQEGKVTFRYQVKPHNGYNAGESNKFGIEQAQPLIHVLCNNNPIQNQLIKIDNRQVFLNVLKPMADGKSTILRFRSFSDKEETIGLTWPVRKPQKLFYSLKGDEVGDEVISDLKIPAKGFISIFAKW